ncbi:hypothetical protein ZIOFF_006633 [Zingiber officinale]|uniref:Uncharacterized protein n=1 Tax=Zingiber officinale TaxID=94328 RepID=A0A8J5M300_ZINOF|nr:hypothetical protein ZIOFF_006633 [Zingiber officinale]
MSTKGSSKGSENSRKNASGSRTDPGWEHRYDVVGNSRKACISVPDDVKKKMLSLVCKIAQASETKKRIICSNEDSSDIGEESIFKDTGGKVCSKTILDGRFWRNVVTCLKAASPLIKGLRLVDFEEPAMGFIYKAMEAAKEKIKVNFGGEKKLFIQKKRNRLHQKKMNDLVFVYYNLKMQGKKSKEVSQTLTTFEEFPSDDEWITEAPSSVGLNLVDEDYDANINNDPLELINLVDDVDNLEGTQITSAHVGVESNIGDKDAIGCDNELDGTDDFDAEDEDEDGVDDLDVTLDDLS